MQKFKVKKDNKNFIEYQPVKSDLQELGSWAQIR